jgi:hypothetical protein
MLFTLAIAGYANGKTALRRTCGYKIMTELLRSATVGDLARVKAPLAENADVNVGGVNGVIRNPVD